MIKKALTNCPPITYNGERSAIPKREYYLSSPVGNRLFDLALGPIALALCASSSVNDQKLVLGIKKNSHRDFFQQFLQTKGIGDETNNNII